MSSFVHLHVHTDYSILDGQAKINKLINKALADNMPALAITDHGNMFGSKEFFNSVNYTNSKREKEGKSTLKPIIGCEVYVARRGRQMKQDREDLGGYHLILLAKNFVGYHNLIRLVSMGWVGGYYNRPRIDKEILERYKEGLIVSSACLGGEIPRLIQADRIEQAKESILWFKSLFGGDYYLELQRHKTTDPLCDREVWVRQEKVNKQLIEFSRSLGVKLIATNDVHFVEAHDAEAHDRLICLSTGKDLDDPNRMRYSKQEWFKTTAEMAALFADVPQALETTLEIADKVELYNINSKPIMPDFPIPDGFSSEADYLVDLTTKGAAKRYGDPLADEVKQRIDFELKTILGMGFPGYFLIVQDFIAAARNMGVAVGPGRGSAAGSVVAYSLGITDIDPMKYDLLFERFLNPDRISMPDIDIDFDDDGRGEVLRWVTEKYGKEKVAHIITYGSMATKSAIKDVARVQKLPLTESDRLTKLIPDKIPNVKKVNLSEAIKHVAELQEAANSSNPVLRDTMKYALMLEGTVRNTGVHACGVIISKTDLMDYVPISTAKDKETNEELLVTQYEGSVIEEIGLLKMDFLGLKTLSIIKEAVENIYLTTGNRIDIATIDLEDEATYKLYSKGDTTGTFQFESAGMQKYLRDLQPSKFEDLIAMNALYRPGPMEYIPQFIARKHGKEALAYDIPIMERYLKDTYGITVYQEQVMLLSRLLAGFTPGQSDELRKVMGKKLIEKMGPLKLKFMAGAKANGHDEKVCLKIWGDWEKFASYAFNKSHATCYSWVAYQTAYLKANYPSEYMAAVLSRNISNITDITKFMDECKVMNIQVLGPDVNESHLKFGVNKAGDIRFGLGAVKGVGEAAVANIVEERQKNGPYKGLFDFIERVNLNACNKKTIESLALAGAFDDFGEVKREHFLSSNAKGELFLETLVRYGNKFQADKQAATFSLFGGEHEIEITRPELPPAIVWSTLDRLNKERELVGIYLSAHPLDEFAIELEYGCTMKMADVKEKEQFIDRDVRLGGMITAVKRGTTRKGDPYAVLTVEDFSGTAEFPFFSRDFVTYNNYFFEGLFVCIKARVQPRKYDPNTIELRINQIDLLRDIKSDLVKRIAVKIPFVEIDSLFVSDFTELLRNHPGDTKLAMYLVDSESNRVINTESALFTFTPHKSIFNFLREIEGLEILPA